MKYLLIALTAALALPTATPLQAGIPSSLKGGAGATGLERWVKIDSNYWVDTEDVLKSGKILRFYIQRRATKEDYEGFDLLTRNYLGKLRINCHKYQSKLKIRIDRDFVFGDNYNSGGTWDDIRPSSIAYRFANDLCFLTGVEGYTREKDEKPWVTKIIETVQNQTEEDQGIPQAGDY
tara:strand:- start:165 stop:698 length:534 start_codon:yes stop_codon:yes gene_type:complete